MRANTRPMRHAEGMWEHLDRRGGAGYEGVRALINDWFARVREGKGRRDLAARLRANEFGAWFAAFWELYLHEALRRAGYELEIEPDISGSEHHPDFLVRGRDHEFYVEALAIIEDPATAVERRRKHIYDYLNRYPHASFWLGFVVRREGKAGLPVRRLLSDVRRWFDGLDPDATPSGTSMVWESGDWVIKLYAQPKSPAARARVGGQLLGMYVGWTGMPNMGPKVRERLHSKANRYAKLDKPFLIAMTAGSTLVRTPEVVEALLGPVASANYEDHLTPTSSPKLDGLIIGAGGPQHTRVSGFIVAWDVFCTDIGKVRPSVWLNPWASPERAFTAPLPFDRVVIDPATGDITPEPSDFDPLPYFGLPPDWPGFEHQ
ncbi:MAG TPA: hypothetical protein VF293_05000 [Candidatus Limnocylindrales bacterium]